MPQIINTNLQSLNAQRNLNKSQSELSSAVQRLSSGLRVNSAKDDAAGLSIATRMDAQVRGMNVAIRNSNDAISMAQVAEGSLGKVTDALQRMRELSVQSANGTYQDSPDRESLNAEYQQLAEEITRVIGATKFNGLAVIAGDAGSLSFQVGANTATEDQVAITTVDLSADSTITAVTSGSISDASSALSAIDSIDSALNTVNSNRATLGAAQNRFEAIVSNLQISAENQTASKSRIMDADFASEAAALARAQVLQQAGIGMVAQANQSSQIALKLLP